MADVAARRSWRSPLVVLLLAVVAWPAGAWGEAPASQPAEIAPPAARQDERKIFLLHLPGIGGARRIDRTFTQGLKDADAADQVQIYDWVGPDEGLAALSGIQRHQEQARRVAEILTDYNLEHPEHRIVLTGHSGGTGVAIFALEMLDDIAAERSEKLGRSIEPVSVDALVLVASALSPTYDLSEALSRVSGAAYSISSEHDQAVLGFGTRNFGTIDRQFVEAAGLLGFVRPATADSEQYAKLKEVPYAEAFDTFGNPGSHLGPMRRTFSRNVVGELVLSSFGEENRRLPEVREVPVQLDQVPTTQPVASQP